MTTDAGSVVVYVDDEPILCRIFASVIAAAGIPVKAFTDPVEALDYINAHDVFVVFSDYRMPKLNGLELLRRVQKAVPFYVVSGELDVERWTDGEARVTGTLAKPFRPELLLELIAKHRVALAP